MNLPCPRFEFLWEKFGDTRFNWKCTYSLVIPLGQYDLRHTDGEGKPKEIKLEIGTTKTTISRGTPVRLGEVDTPFRDGAHAQWDCDALGGHIPIVAVCGESMTLVPKQPKEQSAT
jgi:hypothetical protein